MQITLGNCSPFPKLGREDPLQSPEARASGVCDTLQRILDQHDPFFGGTWLMATDSYAIKLSIQYAGYSVELQGPCRFAPIEEELTDDLLYFRRAACEASRPPTGLAATTRYYRSYLQASVSVVESFINRYVHLLKHTGHSAATELAQIRPLDERLETWVAVVTGKPRDSFRKGAEWSQFCELRSERNRLVHALEPFMGHSINDMARTLNFVREGVGGLLILLRRLAEQEPLGFMQRLKSAPVVTARKAP
jgi:hypothetical protein